MEGTLKLNEVSFFVLDEMDRMLDAGFKEELNKISKAFNESAQTLLFQPPPHQRCVSGQLSF